MFNKNCTCILFSLYFIYIRELLYILLYILNYLFHFKTLKRKSKLKTNLNTNRDENTNMKKKCGKKLYLEILASASIRTIQAELWPASISDYTFPSFNVDPFLHKETIWKSLGRIKSSRASPLIETNILSSFIRVSLLLQTRQCNSIN